MQQLTLIEKKHPDKTSEEIYEGLIGLEKQKDALTTEITLLLDKKYVDEWHHSQHDGKLKFLSRVITEMPLVILSGEVGCGKSALANSIATPVAKKLGKRITCFETPSDIRGSGLVGELSARVTSTFQQAKSKVGPDGYGILIIDEADDLATSRSQNQAHHEDRAGLNVLVKQIDSISKEKVNLVVILITNRINVLDAAIVRRASLTLTFNRPNDDDRKKIFQYIFSGTKISEKDIEKLIVASQNSETPYSYSDLINRVGRQALLRAVKMNQAFTASVYLDVLKEIAPSPLVG